MCAHLAFIGLLLMFLIILAVPKLQNKKDINYSPILQKKSWILAEILKIYLYNRKKYTIFGEFFTMFNRFFLVGSKLIFCGGSIFLVNKQFFWTGFLTFLISYFFWFPTFPNFLLFLISSSFRFPTFSNFLHFPIY